MRIPEGIEIGTIYETNGSGKLEITKYINTNDVEVKFIDTGFEVTTRMEQIRNGEVKDPLHRSVFGIGFIGVGEHKVSIKSKHTKAYTTWNNMLERCYSEARQSKQPTYKSCTVHPDWHNFQIFAKWYHDNHPNDGDNYHLDKDILIEGNKVYSSRSCIFASPKDNAIKASAKSYKFNSPDNEEVEIYNLRQFCRDNSLDQSAMCKVYSRKAKQHKGWSLA